jgi:dihydroneopterin aldolase
MLHDVVSIGPMQVEASIGWFADERTKPQILLIRIEFGLNTKKAAATDDLIHTVDYDIALQVKALVEHSSCKLVETLVEQIATLCLEKTLAENVKVLVQKRLPFDLNIPGSVEIYRRRT